MMDSVLAVTGIRREDEGEMKKIKCWKVPQKSEIESHAAGERKSSKMGLFSILTTVFAGRYASSFPI
jgi:hypothetical protein